MYLKSIEVQGFKSFANKITLKFHNGITGIVGPNGSGKSNVADAVRWVLGEQRVKQLRGGSMQDVIFSGTELRKPLSYAYVAITLDNSDHQLAIDYDEVTVSRRLYRSGESEYMINGTICRLKDVNELFYDTGIGKEGYSIIGQGQIDKILSGKPEERRELFDEAAGIVKFKRRKALSLKKLEDEQQNLVRVSDILAELEKQIGPLEKQSEKAKIFLRKKESLKYLDVNVFLLENVRIREQLKEVETNHEIVSGDLTQSQETYERIKREYEAIESQIELLGQAIDQAKTELTDTDVMRSKLEGQINVLKEQIHSVEGNEEHLQNRVQAISQDIALKKEEIEKHQVQKNQVFEELEALENARKEAKALLEEVQLKITQLDNQMEASKNAIMKVLTERSAIKAKMGSCDSMVDQINIRKAELNAKMLRAKSDEEEQVQAIKDLEARFEAISVEIREIDGKQKQSEEKLDGLRKELIGKDEALRAAQTKYHQEKSKLEALVNLTERYEGYGGSVKAVMEQKDSVKGIIGVVADIIHAPAEYEVAIEIALGGNLQNIVTENEETAKEMIRHLKKMKAGRATFLPLTSILNPQEFKTPEVLNEQGAIGLASELVSVDDKYQNVAKSMLGRIVVVDTIDHAVAIARKYDYGVRMVTLEGELLVPGGAISGGAFKHSTNLLGRRREIESLEKNVSKQAKEIESLQKAIEQTKGKRNQLRMEIESLKADLQRKFIEQNTARLNVQQAKERQGEKEDGYSELRLEQKELEEQLKQILLEKDEIANQLSDSVVMENNHQDAIEQYRNELLSLREIEGKRSLDAAAYDVDVEKLRQMADFQKQNMDRVTAELERFQNELLEVQAGLSDGKEAVEHKKKQIEEIKLTIEASFSTKNEVQKKLQQDLEERENLSGKQKNFFAERESISQRIAELDKEVYRLTTQKEKLEASIENQINYMWDEYEITLSDAASLRDEAMTDLSDMKQQIAQLKDEIKKLGVVNVNAIEEFKALTERYQNMKTQYDDLVEAEKTLQNIISELDISMRKQFQEKFSQINREFDKVFRELFGGGKGTLELMEDEDILEAGIKIIAQPPGKKLVNMMQMSGGEKALTAIALLFAIQNLKPSPFCLLDEIEAALDESNVSRFAGYLHKLTKNTQFIVITHRRGTMDKVDRLYGITMQEKGVSTLVSVNLIDKELDD